MFIFHSCDLLDFIKNLEWLSITMAGISTNAQNRQTNSENMIRKPKALSIVKPDRKSTANPAITESAFRDIPRPVVLNVL